MNVYLLHMDGTEVTTQVAYCLRGNGSSVVFGTVTEYMKAWF